MMTQGFQHSVPNSHKNVALHRFYLKPGQIFVGDNVRTNLWWVLDGVTIGHGDLQQSDIERIKQKLEVGEVFIGWNEHHGTRFEQTADPIVHITAKEITYPHRERRDGGSEEPSS